MTTLLLTVIVASLLGSLHCAGMCGGFVAFYAGSPSADDASRGRALAHLAYNLSRLLVYATMGAVAGALGAGLDLAGASAAHLQRVAGWLAGGVMVLWGLAMLLPLLAPSAKLPRLGRLPGPLTRALDRSVAALAAKPPVLRAAALGALTVLLPCGWLYAFVISAAGTGSALYGAALMATFWLGTVPVLIGLGLGVQTLARKLGRTLPALTALALVAIGVVSLASRVSVAPTLAPAPGSIRSATERVRGLGSTKRKPCCDGTKRQPRQPRR